MPSFNEVPLQGFMANFVIYKNLLILLPTKSCNMLQYELVFYMSWAITFCLDHRNIYLYAVLTLYGARDEDSQNCNPMNGRGMQIFSYFLDSDGRQYCSVYANNLKELHFSSIVGVMAFSSYSNATSVTCWGQIMYVIVLSY